MSFVSLAFLVFLPLTVLLHWLTPHRFRWILLLTASYVFYAWWNVSLSLLILSITAVSYAAALAIDRAQTSGIRRLWLVLALASSLGILFYFKYYALLARTIVAFGNLVGGSGSYDILNIILPVGVSFYTFQALSYVVDVYRGNLPVEKHFGYYALFVSFFPQLVAGPIERVGNLLPQLRQERKVCKADLAVGLRLLTSGFFRKLVVADMIAPLVNAVYGSQNPDGSAVFVGTALFALQIYCDFAGYSEIAAGAARLLGVRLMQNFNKPYGAYSLKDFWHRWHISLSRWFSDYVYIPIGGNRRGLKRQIAAILIVFTLSGLWHGAAWSFVLWGFLHGFFMVLELMGNRFFRKNIKAKQFRSPLWGWLTKQGKHTGTLAVVCFSWIFFRAGSITRAFDLIKALFSPWHWEIGAQANAYLAQHGGIPAFVLYLLCILPLLRVLPSLTDEDKLLKPVADSTWAYFLLCIAIAWLIQLGTGTTNAFIYFQF